MSPGYLVAFFLPAIATALPLRVRALVWGALAAHRQATAMTQAAVAAQIHQSLDVHGNFAPQIALDAELTVDQFADAQHFPHRRAG